MHRPSLVRDTALLAIAGAIGWWAHGSQQHVQAASEANMLYQFDSLTPATSLTLYNPDEHTIYVYQGATAGSSHLNCSFRYHVARAGAPIEREICAPGSLLR